ncbi:MAG: tetratricopeptide repeat protein, partial [Bacteroidota bacterium]|nr:tetratricopeptide repeat protein [Bacteroidota bacterium]
MKKKAKQGKTTSETNEAIFSKKNLLWLSLFLVFCFALFSPSLDNEFVNWDDDWMVYENPDVVNFSIARLPAIFSEFYKGQYSPVCTMSLGMQYAIGGGQPLSFHVFGILYHLLNIVLVFWLIKLLFKKNRIAFIVAILFGVHSLQVESVVWISAQKVTLYTIFFLASCIAYIKYVNGKKLLNYLLAIFFFIVSFLAKEQAVTLAVSLIAIDFILKRNLLDKKVILEKLPFLILAGIMGIVTIYSSRTGEFFTDDNKNPFHEQIAYSAYAFIQYLLQMIFPFKMSAFHPYPTGSMKEFSNVLWLYLVPVILIIYAFFKSIKKNPVITFGILFFLMNIALVLQLMPLRDFITADRYVYIPAIGFFLIIAWYADKIINKNKKYSTAVIAVISVYTLLLSFVSYQRSNIWQNSLALFTDVSEKYPESSIGWNNRGLALSNLDRNKDAIEDYKKAIKYNPQSVFCYNNIGISYSKTGNYQNAFKSFDAAITMRPDF